MLISSTGSRLAAAIVPLPPWLAATSTRLLDRMSSHAGSPQIYMLAVLRTLLEFGVPRGYREDNPAIGVKRLKVEDSGHSPVARGPATAFVMEHAPTHLRRMAFLGRATGQRVSDLVRDAPRRPCRATAST